jgi:hypothetical protein
MTVSFMTTAVIILQILKIYEREILIILFSGSQASHIDKPELIFLTIQFLLNASLL